MPVYPECPFCEYRLSDADFQSIEGSIKIRCPACEQRYEFIPQTGSFPLDDDFGIKVSKGVLGPHVVNGSPVEGTEVSLSRALLIGSLCCCTIAVVVPVVLALLLALFG